MSYFIIMKYNITNETFLPAAQRNFPGATDMQLSDMLLTTLFYFWPAILISFATYYIIFLFVKPVLNSNTVWSNLIIGFLLSLTTPILFFYMSSNQSVTSLKIPLFPPLYAAKYDINLL